MNSCSRVVIAVVLLCAALQPVTANAANWTGAGGTPEFSTAGNWSASGPPANDGTEIAFFPPLSGEYAPEVDQPWHLLGLTTAASSGSGLSYTLLGSPLYLYGSGIAVSDGAHPVNLRINNPVLLQADQTWSSAGGISLWDILSFEGHSLLVDGSGTTTFLGELVENGVLEKTGTGILRISPSVGGSFNITKKIFEGTMILGCPDGPASRGNIFVGDGVGPAESDVLLLATPNQLHWLSSLFLVGSGLFDMNGHDDEVGNIEITDGRIVGDGGALTLHGDLTAWNGLGSSTIDGILDLTSGPHVFDVKDGSLPDDLSLVTLANSQAGAACIKRGTGSFALVGAGSYDGSISVEEGTMRVATSSGLATNGAMLDVQTGASFIVDSQGLGSGLRLGGFAGAAGSTAQFESGHFEVSGGTASFPTDSMVLGNSPTGLLGAMVMSFTNGANASVRYTWLIGDVAGSFAVTNVDGVENGVPSTLSNFGGGSGADLVIGDEGYGSVAVTQGGFVEFNDDCRLAVGVGGSGDLLVSGVKDGNRSVARFLGAGSEVEIGRRGDASLQVNSGALLQSSNDVIAAGIEGTAGILMIGAQAGVPPTIVAGDDFILGGTESAAGGTATMTTIEALIDVADLFKVWDGSSINMVNSTLRAATFDATTGDLSFANTVLAVETILGDVDLDGAIIEPGNSPGITAIQGNLTMQSSGGLGMEIGALAHDVVDVTGDVVLGGSLEIRLLDGYVPRVGSSFKIMSAGSITGAFESMSTPNISGLWFSVVVNPFDVRVEVLSSTDSGPLPDADRRFALYGNHPNPFNPMTTISYAIAEDAPVKLEIFDQAGRLVRTLVDQRLEAGEHTAHWNGKDDAGHGVASGVYLYRVLASGQSQARRMVLVR